MDNKNLTSEQLKKLKQFLKKIDNKNNFTDTVKLIDKKLEKENKEKNTFSN